jgi:hypothetical protein
MIELHGLVGQVIADSSAMSEDPMANDHWKLGIGH